MKSPPETVQLTYCGDCDNIEWTCPNPACKKTHKMVEARFQGTNVILKAEDGSMIEIPTQGLDKTFLDRMLR